MQVSVAYTEPALQVWLSLDVPESSTVLHAIERSGILARCPELDLQKHKVGVFGKITQLTASLADGDRVEIYRPITVDPKTVPQRKIVVLDEEDED
ncbi:MAG TPA: RnfH family protein [Candidatus Competibacter sp.]|nr:RnfH family protein [Candidatus Competibacteraceae bacterium]MBK8508219.1 RnfH family protein [Candidatus Competibacteraceae bacterium]HAO33377.1 RnfH family protein [Candidatus Competibacteraceae bacterium]HUM96090.1 RnfH family protein [Candidatus Competibacter sp.]